MTLVGREAELERLHALLAGAEDGRRRVALVTGEPGIGKTALVEAFLTGAAARGARVLRGEAAVLDHAPAATRAARTTREAMLRETAEALEASAVRQPYVVLLEDLHASGSGAIEMLTYLARREAPARLVLLATYRPAEARLEPGLEAQEVALDGLPVHAVVRYLMERRTTTDWEPAAVQVLAEALHRRTEGHPLFMTAVVEQLAGKSASDAIAAVASAVPTNMHRLIEQQFTALREDDRRLLEAGSVSGMVFSAASAAAALGADVSSVADRCARLAFVEPAGTEAWPDGTVAPRFRFRHAMYQEAVYARVPAGRRPQLHDRVGAREEAAWQAQAGERAAVLAMHFERGRDHERAMRYRKLAATVAVQRFADHDAVEHLQRGLESLARVPDSPARAVEEQEFLIALSLALVSTKGHAAPELEPVLARSEVLSRQVDDAVKRFEFLQSMFAFRGVRGEHRRAMAVTDELLAVAERLKDAGMRLAAHRAAAVGALNIGAFASARAHFERALSFYDPERHALPRAIPGSTRNYAVNCHVRLAHVLWILGEDEQATAHADQGVAMARALAHPYGLVEALYERAQLQLARGNRRAALTDADEGFARAREFPRFAALTTFVRGAALGRDGVTAMRDGLAAVQATGTVLGVPRFLSLLAEACPLDEGLRLSQRALALVAKTEERTFESEIHRVHGELLRQSGDVAGAAFMFRRAIEVARAQAARAFERNATASLERLR